MQLVRYCCGIGRDRGSQECTWQKSKGWWWYRRTRTVQEKRTLNHSGEMGVSHGKILPWKWKAWYVSWLCVAREHKMVAVCEDRHWMEEVNSHQRVSCNVQNPYSTYPWCRKPSRPYDRSVVRKQTSISSAEPLHDMYDNDMHPSISSQWMNLFICMYFRQTCSQTLISLKFEGTR